jgi:hypothetical protein
MQRMTLWPSRQLRADHERLLQLRRESFHPTMARHRRHPRSQQYIIWKRFEQGAIVTLSEVENKDEELELIALCVFAWQQKCCACSQKYGPWGQYNSTQVDEFLEKILYNFLLCRLKVWMRCSTTVLVYISHCSQTSVAWIARALSMFKP